MAIVEAGVNAGVSGQTRSLRLGDGGRWSVLTSPTGPVHNGFSDRGLWLGCHLRTARQHDRGSFPPVANSSTQEVEPGRYRNVDSAVTPNAGSAGDDFGVICARCCPGNRHGGAVVALMGGFFAGNWSGRLGFRGVIGCLAVQEGIEGDTALYEHGQDRVRPAN